MKTPAFTPVVIELAAEAIFAAAQKNPHITPETLRDELARGDISGWLKLAAVRACTLSEWSQAMSIAAAELAVGRAVQVCDGDEFRAWSGFPFYRISEGGVDMRRVSFNRVVWG